MGHSSIHRGDFRRARRSVNVARVELEALEPRIQLAFKLGQIPASTAADVSLARLMVEELDDLLRHGLDFALGDAGRYADVYNEVTYDRSKLVGKETP